MKKLILLPLLILSFQTYCQHQDSTSQSLHVKKDIQVYPRSWWVGMKNPRLQLLVHGKNIADAELISYNLHHPGITIENIQRGKNSNYLFINLLFSPEAKPGEISFDFHSQSTRINVSFTLLPYPEGNGFTYARGVNSSDFIYLLMPDRFSNGNNTNDRYGDLKDTVADRSNPLARHGGDLQGVAAHLEYLQKMGVTTLWLTPVLENDMPLEKESAGWVSGYHGYWFTDHYEIDKRLGGHDAYLNLVTATHARGMKIIQDAVYNHIGSGHWLMKDLPDSSWINQWPDYQNTNHREQTLFDIHAANSDREIMEAGWFVPHLPDLNLRNPFLATYLIQQAIWMTQTFRLDGWRVDTYKYCDRDFLNQLNDALEKEFPSVTSLGEATVSSVAAGAYFCRNNMNVSWKSNLSGILDFPVCNAMLESLKKNYGWSDGVMRLYTTLSEDMLYKQPLNNCIFLDNHDMDRFYSVIGENMANYKMGIGLLLTQRGIPHLYYGTEILMKNLKNPSDAMVREDFPGGFPGDSLNKFLTAGQTMKEREAFQYVSKLANFRKSSSALCDGALMQYLPSKNVYVYFRYNPHQTILCALNTDSVTVMIHPKDYRERTSDFSSAVDCVTGRQYNLGEELNLLPRSITILELKKAVTDNKSVH